MTDLTAHVQPAIPQHWHKAEPRACPECGNEQAAGHVRCTGCHDPRRKR